MPIITSKNSPIVVKIMVFIDAAYFLRWLKKIGIEKEEYNFEGFSINMAGKNGFPQLDTVQLIRTYYYDGLINPRKTSQFNEQQMFHGHLNYSFSNYEVKLGLTTDQGELRQKGVDSMLAFDMVSKAHSNQFDIAILVARDLDHLPAVKMVKDLGKEVYGVYYADKSLSKVLANEFDSRCILSKGNSSYKLSKPFFDNYKEYMKK